MTTPWRILAPSVLSAILVLPACSSGGADDHPESTPAPASNRAGARDACRLVTQEEATSLLGVAASRGTSGNTVVDPAMIGECLWEYDTPTTNQLLQVRVWESPKYYGAPQDEFTTPFDLGEKGYLRAHPGAGVDIVWIQGGRVVELSYSTVGSSGDPRAIDHVEEVKALARKASGRL